MKKHFPLVILVIISLVLANLVFKDDTAFSYSKSSEENKQIAIMVYDELKQEYVKKSKIPVGGYSIDKSRSYCTNGGVISGYSSLNGTIKYSINTGDKCYVYFKTKDPDIQIAVQTDGVVGTIPTGNKYQANLSCTNASSNYNFNYRRIEISETSGETIACTLNYTQENISSYPLLKDVVEDDATHVQIASISYGYRYQGKQPDNWVWFNDELWRIIGSVPVCTNATIASGATSGTCNERTNLVKIIRNESIGGLAYHRSGTNTVWGSGNTLYTLLNEKYHGKGNAAGASPCYGYSTYLGTCDYRINGISKSENDYYNKMIESVHMNVGTVSSTSTYIDVAYDLETNLVTEPTTIGLMNVSDYGYAASGITYSSTDLSSLSSSVVNNWLYGNGYEWTMTPYSTASVMLVRINGYATYGYAYYGYATRPILYLDSGVYIRGGTGTITNPYILGL